MDNVQLSKHAVATFYLSSDYSRTNKSLSVGPKLGNKITVKIKNCKYHCYRLWFGVAQAQPTTCDSQVDVLSTELSGLVIKGYY